MKRSIKFRYTASVGWIKGIAFSEAQNAIVDFSLEWGGESSVDIEGKTWTMVIFRADATLLGVMVYDIFDEVLSKYGERDWRFPAKMGNSIYSQYRVYEEKLPRMVEDILKIVKGEEHEDKS